MLKVGLFLPFAETMLDGSTPRWADLRTMAQLAEDVGFDSLWFGDHLLAQFENGTFGCWECWSLVTAVAAVTHRVTLWPLVACTSYRNPALLAKMADTVDEISTDLARYQAAIDAACAEIGRDPATLEHTVAVRIDLPGVQRHPFDWFDRQVSGSTEELAAFLHGYADLGVTHLQICLGPNTPAGIEAFAPVLALLDQG